MKLRQTGKMLQKFLNALQKQLCDHLDQQSKHILWELEQLKPASYEKFTSSIDRNSENIFFLYFFYLYFSISHCFCERLSFILTNFVPFLSTLIKRLPINIIS